ncbi:hypothetical protein C9374_009983 [Naegleria lovaniensis]|uniref:Uncharacterized protein n=1 Tax=Naegleria lovaniensis TaxID=51637 RepID=A0AA88GD68_NAELO|nr:uncharacterized protein C9374_009983 [Naegleria lovaniensis]KAG2375360.1 hypothetical protein C9374_009983 [Naegleria lovaniensis]
MQPVHSTLLQVTTEEEEQQQQQQPLISEYQATPNVIHHENQMLNTYFGNMTTSPSRRRPLLHENIPNKYHQNSFPPRRSSMLLLPNMTSLYTNKPSVPMTSRRPSTLSDMGWEKHKNRSLPFTPHTLPLLFPTLSDQEVPHSYPHLKQEGAPRREKNTIMKEMEPVTTTASSTNDVNRHETLREPHVLHGATLLSSQKHESHEYNLREMLLDTQSLLQQGKHFFLIGLGYCRIFHTIKEMIIYLSKQEESTEHFWMDCQQCSSEDMMELQYYFNLHPLTVEDCVNNDSGEKWEAFDNYLFICITGQTTGRVVLNEYLPCYLNMVIFERCILTIHDKPIEGLDLLINRIEKEFEFNQKKKDHKSDSNKTTNINTTSPSEQHSQSFFVLTPSWIFYAYLDAIVDVYVPKVDQVIRECDTVDEFTATLTLSDKEDLLWRIAFNKRRVAILRKLLLPKQKMVAFMVASKLPIPFLDPEAKHFLRDILDHLKQCCERLDMARDSFAQTHSNYLSRVHLDIAQHSQATDVFMNRITVFVVLLAPVTLIAGIWGMNMKVPGQGVKNLYWFFGVCSAMAVVALFMVILLRKLIMNI